jgi:uncharacterized protein (DUF1501 family)
MHHRAVNYCLARGRCSPGRICRSLPAPKAAIRVFSQSYSAARWTDLRPWRRSAILGPAWRKTVVALATEFGRTAHINGTSGTDHGTATVALLVGGALKGGRVIADWPGLKPADLYQNRDLKPTTDLRAVLKGALRDHLHAEEKALAQTVFPGSEAVKPMTGLVG